MLESRLLGEISITSDMQMTPLLWQKAKRNWGASWGKWKGLFKTQHSKNEIMATGPITSWHIDGETMETVTDFMFLGSKIKQMMTATMKLKDAYSLGEKLWPSLDSILESRDITLSTKVRLVKAMVFPVVMYGCESWTIKKAECQRIDVFELWCWRRLLRVPWTARRSNQSILKEVSSECSLEGLMLKLKLNTLEFVKSWLIWKDPDAGKDWRREEKGMTEDEMIWWHL